MIEGGVMVEGVRGDFFIVAVLLVVWTMFGYGETVSRVDVVM